MIGTQLVKILVIDDHEVVRRGVKQILEEAFPHVEVGEADTGQKGIAAVQQEPRIWQSWISACLIRVGWNCCASYTARRPDSL
jgi:CheY-like chemotaxis protein